MRVARLGVEVGDDRVGERVAVLDQRDRAGERAVVAVPHSCREGLARPVAPAGHAATRPAAGASERARLVTTRSITSAVSEPHTRSIEAIPYVQRGADEPHERAGRDHGDAEQRVLRADDHGERAPSQPVRRVALHDQDGHRERKAVSEAREHHRRAATQMFGAIAGPEDAGGPRQEDERIHRHQRRDRSRIEPL